MKYSIEKILHDEIDPIKTRRQHFFASFSEIIAVYPLDRVVSEQLLVDLVEFEAVDFELADLSQRKSIQEGSSEELSDCSFDDRTDRHPVFL